MAISPGKLQSMVTRRSNMEHFPVGRKHRTHVCSVLGAVGIRADLTYMADLWVCASSKAPEPARGPSGIVRILRCDFLRGSRVGVRYVRPWCA